MKKSGIIFTIKSISLKKSAKSPAWSLVVAYLSLYLKPRYLPDIFSRAWALKILLLVATTGLLWFNTTRIAGSQSTEDNGIFNRIVQLVITSTPTPTPTITPSPTPTPTPLMLPLRLIIEKLGVDAEIEFVGVDENGKMEVPSQWGNVAWFKNGPVPGEPGNVVIAGHYDTDRGRPAVFYNLARLAAGDIIQVSTIFENTLTFQVTGSESYAYDQVPIDYIFGTYDIPRLVLLTCNGYFNRGIQSYSHRIAVFSELL